jgi:WhiB family transcriptional regulator, redox-sensing transcriptional regulator
VTALHRAIGGMPGPWVEDAACIGVPVNVFFPEVGYSADIARAICSSCPVMMECRDYAVFHEIRFGIYGNTTPKERAKMRRALR